jgi:hypothetical protein
MAKVSPTKYCAIGKNFYLSVAFIVMPSSWAMICPTRVLFSKNEKSSSPAACHKGESAAKLDLNLVYKFIIGVKLTLKYHNV